MVYLERKSVFVVALLPAPAFAAASHETPAGDRHAAHRAGAAAALLGAPAGQYVNVDSKRAEVVEGPAGDIRGTEAHVAVQRRRGHGRARYHPCQLEHLPIGSLL